MNIPLPQEDDQLTTEELAEFKHSVLAENMRRFLALLGLGALLNLVVIALERQVTGGFDAITWLRVSGVAAIVPYLFIIGKPGKRPYGFQKPIFLGAVGLSLLFTAMISGQVASMRDSTFIFIIDILLTGTFLVLPLREMLGVTLPGILYLGVAFASAAGRGLDITLLGNIVNIASVTALSIMIAHILYNARRQRFAYEVVIRRHNEFLKTLAGLDGLTGAANRRRIDEAAASMQAFAVREGAWVAVLMFDLDNFKAYNDSCGHLAGDELLKSAAAAMQGVLQREGDLLGRYGGDEFIALLPSTEAAGAQLIAERVRQAVCGLAVPFPGSETGVVTVSGGLAAGIPTQEAGMEAIIQRADQALYRAKRAGRNRVEE